jgi:twitching motility protein PilJ
MALQRDLREVEVKQVGLLGAQTLEAPYTGFFGKLRVPYKLALLVVPLLLPIFYLLFALVSEQRNDINFVRTEKQGVIFLQSTGSLIKAMAEHRSLSAATLSGNQELVVPRTQKAEEINRGLQLLVKMNQAEGDSFGIGERLEALKTSWDTLLAVPHSPTRSFQEHTRLIGQFLRLYEQIAISSNLILDPTAQSYWLVDSVVYRLQSAMETLSPLGLSPCSPSS